VAFWNKGSGSAKTDEARQSSPPTELSSTTSSRNGEATASSLTTAAKPPEEDPRTWQKKLQRQLRRQVSFPDEGRFKKTMRVATNPYLVLGAATVGVGVAGVLTAGTAHVVLGAVGAGQLSTNGSKAIEWWKARKQGTVYLVDKAAVDYLRSVGPVEQQVERVQAVLSARPPGDARITKQDLIDASAKPANAGPLSRAVSALRSPYGRAGLAILGAGMFLIAVTVIPEYIHNPSLRVAAVLSAIGGILIASAMLEAFKGVLMGTLPSSMPQALDEAPRM
jgi:hypothetical protein